MSSLRLVVYLSLLLSVYAHRHHPKSPHTHSPPVDELQVLSFEFDQDLSFLHSHHGTNRLGRRQTISNFTVPGDCNSACDSTLVIARACQDGDKDGCQKICGDDEYENFTDCLDCVVDDDNGQSRVAATQASLTSVNQACGRGSSGATSTTVTSKAIAVASPATVIVTTTSVAVIAQPIAVSSSSASPMTSVVVPSTSNAIAGTSNAASEVSSISNVVSSTWSIISSASSVISNSIVVTSSANTTGISTISAAASGTSPRLSSNPSVISTRPSASSAVSSAYGVSAAPSSSSHALSTGVAVGVALGAVLAAALFLALLYWCCRRRKARSHRPAAGVYPFEGESRSMSESKMAQDDATANPNIARVFRGDGTNQDRRGYAMSERPMSHEPTIDGSFVGYETREVVRHTDGGVLDTAGVRRERIELPPLYEDIPRPKRGRRWMRSARTK